MHFTYYVTTFIQVKSVTGISGSTADAAAQKILWDTLIAISDPSCS